MCLPLGSAFKTPPKGGAVTIPIFQKRKLRHKEQLVPVHTARKSQSRPTAPGSPIPEATNRHHTQKRQSERFHPGQSRK